MLCVYRDNKQSYSVDIECVTYLNYAYTIYFILTQKKNHIVNDSRVHLNKNEL